MSGAKLIALDWGTTSCRAYLLGVDGAILERLTDGPGILKVEHGAFGKMEQGAFGAWLDSMIGGWIATHGVVPVLLSGMIGSRQGWREAPYARCPAGAEDLVAALTRFEHDGLALALMPGLATENDAMPDVMRGEETQILGALALGGRDCGLFLLPGTHSKWAQVSGGRIVAFRTFMTGEVFGALKDHTILGRLMQAGTDAEGFARGVREGAALGSAGALLNRLFAARSYGLTGRLADTALADYLSGLLIGAEVAEAVRQANAAVTIVASATLAQRYQDALRLLGRESTLAPQDCVAAGHWRLARAAALC
ncbi:MAG TPA: 2-dehydro-3-deoxygalactonokinase [Xanthobacteraceae bacterium]|nr:2-dehydro-3-deoxygalactonokinase [Xanthobacteraceae bacterium]